MAARLRRTTVEVGTAFELRALRYLNEGLHMSLKRVGGAGDGGIDLRGWWWLPRMGIGGARGAHDVSPNTSEDAANEWESVQAGGYRHLRRVRVITQCKAEKKTLGPRNVRELEGVMSGLMRRSSGSPETLAVDSPGDLDQAIAILVSQSGFSKNSMVHATASQVPLMLVHLPEESTLPERSGSSTEPLVPPSPGHGTATPEWKEHADSPDLAGEPDSLSGNPSPTAHPKMQSVWWNRALSHGILGDQIELRRNVSAVSGEVSVGLWMGGRIIGRCGPDEGAHS
ncbi:hypothetical protein IAU60_005156 [Kwoniella sp. DSM 27419]